MDPLLPVPYQGGSLHEAISTGEDWRTASTLGLSLPSESAEAPPPVFDDASAFMGGWAASPHPSAAPVAPSPEPAEADPRLLWQRKHADELKVCWG